jgi:hypothetical protein
MNDFTKEELIEMREAVLVINMQFHNYDFRLIEKLQSMIDNYFEHSQSEADHDYEVEKCKECGR